MVTNSTKLLFSKDVDQRLFQRLRETVYDVVDALPPTRKKQMIAKAILFPTAYVSTYYSALLWGKNHAVLFACYALLGILIVVNFLNLVHEAVHGTLFKSKKLTQLFFYFFDVMGANSCIWRIRHIRMHHNYPNVMNWDTDLEQSPFARIFPHGKYRREHRFQHIYLPLLYPLFVLNWLLVRDFKDYFDKSRLVWKVTNIPRKEYFKLFIFKIFFLFYTLVLPIIVTGISWLVSLAAFLIMMFSASLLALLVLLSPHANTESSFPLPNEQGKMKDTWLLHQLRTTNDIYGNNLLTRFFMGCFNLHIAHHLFPNIPHIYYPEITRAIQKFSRENRLPYRQFSLLRSLGNHYRLLKQNSVEENIFEETM